MSSVDGLNLNHVGRLLDKAFTKVDRNSDDQLSHAEFSSFYEVLRPGLVDDYDKAQASANQMFIKMDHNSDGVVSRLEQATTGVAIPAELSLDDSLGAMIKHLQEQDRASAALAAKYLSEADPGTELSSAGADKINPHHS